LTYNENANHQPAKVVTMRIEALEARRLRSVTVHEGYPGFYEIVGDDAPDEISVSVSMADESFTLDGAAYTSVSYILVHGGGGNDNVSVVSLDGAGSISASISGDEGDDNITLNFDGGVWAGSGNDILNLSDAFRGTADGQDGDDQVVISGACLDPEINGGGGNDLIDCSGNIYRVVIHGGGGDDTIYGSAYDDEIYGDDGSDVMYGGAGSDTFYARDGSVDRIIGGSGFDTAYADERDQCGVEFVNLG
jgi:Ca2+-binding RTX toxin-like protein